jgi:putative ABC transport system permease protein
MTMVSALLNKSFGDLKRRKARTFFTILTIALAVSALGMFAVMPLIDEAMEKEVKDSNLHNLQLSMSDLNLTEENLNDLENMKNVKSVESKSIFFTRMYIGERRNDAIIIGITDFSDQKVNIITKDSGNYPGLNQVWSSSCNSRYDLYNGDIGDNLKLYDHQGQVKELKITGTGHTIEYSSYPAWGLAIFYAELETVHTLANTTGINIIDFDLVNTDEVEVDNTVQDVEIYLKENTAFTAFSDLPSIREEGDYPGKQEGNDFANFFYVLTLLTVFCSLFLISNTMHTMITEQRREIGQMKAVGATKLQVFRSYFTTSFIMGIIGAVIGAILGIFIANSLSSFIGSNFYGITVGFSVYIPTILISILVGIGITILATLPALYKALRITTREGMQDSGLTNGFGHSFMDRALMKMGMLPRCTQMGLRNITRKKGRSISTILQVALAVGMFLAVIAFGQSINVMVSEEWDNHTYDILTLAQTEGGKPLTEDMQFVLEDIDGVSVAEPIVGTDVMLDDRELTAYGYNYNTIGYNIDKTIFKGRWFTKEEQENNATVVVFSKTIADLEKIKIGNTVDIIMATGTYQFKVIGLSSGIMNNGMCAFMPITTIQDKMLMNNNVTGFIIKTDNDSHDLIDRTATAIEDEMLSRGYVTENMILYIAEEQNHRANQQLINLMAAVGAIIILITMIGLMSTMTMNIIERTKEIGMLRCVGSSSWSVRSVFGTEGLVLALIGWAVGVPIGYAVGSFLNYMIYDIMHLEMTFIFPLQFVLIALVITTVATLIVIQPPLWRATHFKPGDALRYE